MKKIKTTIRTPVALYCRVSTSTESTVHDINDATARQQQLLKDFCLSRNYEVIATYNDLGSANAKKRPGLENMLLDISNSLPIKGIVILRYDRISRKMDQGFQLKKLLLKRGINLITVETKNVLKKTDLNDLLALSKSITDTLLKLELTK